MFKTLHTISSHDILTLIILAILQNASTYLTKNSSVFHLGISVLRTALKVLF